MLRKIAFKKDHHCFKEGDSFEFLPGVNLLVGDQGTGKSTIFNLLSNRKYKSKEILDIVADKVKTISFDFEKDNIRKSGSMASDNEGMKFQLSAMFSSHGEYNLAMLSHLKSVEGKLILMDEPDMALSIRSCVKLAKLMQEVADNGNQIVASIHNPIVIQGFDQVLSLEHRQWMNGEEFIDSQK